jgi:hypothetical protein
MPFVESLIASYKAIPYLLPLQAASSALPNRARTKNGRAFLESGAEWALLIDDDMAWEPQDIQRLRQTAKEKNAKVVSGFTLMERKVNLKGELYEVVCPHAYQLVEYGGRPTMLPIAALPSREPFEVYAVGGACLLVHRDVYERLEIAARGLTGYPWQEETYQPKMDRQMGEDLVFCSRVRQHGFKIWYEPRAVFAHQQKPRIIGAEEYAKSLEVLEDNGFVYSAYEE